MPNFPPLSPHFEFLTLVSDIKCSHEVFKYSHAESIFEHSFLTHFFNPKSLIFGLTFMFSQEELNSINLNLILYYLITSNIYSFFYTNPLF